MTTKTIASSSTLYATIFGAFVAVLCQHYDNKPWGSDELIALQAGAGLLFKFLLEPFGLWLYKQATTPIPGPPGAI